MTIDQNLLAADTAMGPVTLLVADLDAMIAYYRDAVTLAVIDEGPGQATMGRGTTPLVILQHSPQLRQASPGQAGLFHTAILFDSERALAAALYSVAQHSPGTFTGSADHLVSKAFYFTDPEGNGIELYWDRDRSTWSWTHGVLEMGTLYLDPNAFLQDNLTEEVIENPVYGDAVVGHVHLSVGDTVSAREFYVDRLGFETTVEMPGSALFVSAGKYHHHMAMNVWNSKGAGRRQPTLGLSQVDIVVPSADDLGALQERMKHFGVSTRDDGQTVSIDDPWANLIRVTAATA
jgi:catechol 2,3-dioxygenase